jgi:AraC-like DNA-binding protein
LGLCWRYLSGITTVVVKVSVIILLVFVILFGVLFPYQNYNALWNGEVYSIINLQWLTFILLSMYMARNGFKKMLLNPKQLTHADILTLSVIFGVFAIWLSYFLSKYTSYISGALTSSFCFYLSFIVILYNKSKSGARPKEKYQQKIDEGLIKEIEQKVKAVFEAKKLYTNPNITMPALSQELQVRPQVFSQYLNDNLKKSFTQFINEYRVEEAKRLLVEEKHLKIDAVGMECGFNSSSTFYSTFKKMTGRTPTAYIKS